MYQKSKKEIADQALANLQEYIPKKKQSCRGAFARYVCNKEADVILVYDEVVIKVAAYLPGGMHGGTQIQLRMIRKYRRGRGKGVGLNF